MKTMLIVGNGLAIDLCGHHKILGNWNPSAPMTWDLPSVDRSVDRLVDCFPRLWAKVQAQKETSPNISDFEIFKVLLAQLPSHSDFLFKFEEQILRSEMRHFLAISYSYFQLFLDPFDINDWTWAQYLQSISIDLVAVFSFNYDLIVESALKTFRYQNFLAKPHGSIDVAPGHRAIVAPTGYPLKNFIDLNDLPIRILDRSNLLQPRIEADIVLPTESSPYLKYQWVNPRYKDFRKNVAKDVERCIIAGISYWACDQPEIDFILDSLSPGTEIVIANPNPNKDLLTKAASVGDVLEWNNGPSD